MKRTLALLTLFAAPLLSGATQADAPPVNADADRFMECLSIAEDQRDRDPDPEMKNHWAQYSQVYASNVFFYAGDIHYAFDHIREKFDKWDNMRNFIAQESVNKLALALLAKCDDEAVAHLDRVEPYQTALAAYLKARDDARAKAAP